MLISPHINHNQLILLRWFSIGTMILFTLIAYMLDITLPYFYLLSVITLTSILNLLSHVIKLQKTFTIFVLSHLILDLLTWGLFLALTGGATNPLVFFLLPAVAIAAVILPENQAWTLCLLAISIYTLLWWLYIPLEMRDTQFAAHLHLVGMWIAFVISVAIAVGFIARMTHALRLRDQALSQARETELRNNWIVSLGALAAGTAHELSTPLSTLAILIEEQLAYSNPEREVIADLQLMQTQIRICKQVLTQLTMKAGQLRADERHTWTAAQWLQELAATWQSLHPWANIMLDMDQTVIQLFVIQDVTLDHAICNLVDNAVMAKQDDVSVFAQCVKDQLEVHISDDGPGINAFGFGEHTDRSRNKGLGIGLLLAHSTIERYGGTLTFVPSNQGGTQAIVRLPLDRISATM